MLVAGNALVSKQTTVAYVYYFGSKVLYLYDTLLVAFISIPVYQVR